MILVLIGLALLLALGAAVFILFQKGRTNGQGDGSAQPRLLPAEKMRILGELRGRGDVSTTTATSTPSEVPAEEKQKTLESVSSGNTESTQSESERLKVLNGLH